MGMAFGGTIVAVLELSLCAGCRINCPYCPQAILAKAYSGPSMMTMEVLDKVLRNVPPGIPVNIAGFAEPYQNPRCSDMIRRISDLGHPLQVYTTAYGMTEKDVDVLLSVPLNNLVLHLPDADGQMNVPYTESHLVALHRLAKKQNVKAVCYGTLPESLKGLSGILVHYSLQSRAGNVTSVPQVARRMGVLRCYASPYLDNNILLPDGRLVLCCQDYGLRHVLGDLTVQTWREIHSGRPIRELRAAMREGPCLCRTCSLSKVVGRVGRRATLLSFATSHYQNAQEHLHNTGAPWFDSHLPLTDEDLDADFLARNAELMKYRRGYGFWCWKPYLIRKAVENLQEGEVLMYCDSQLAFVANPAPLFELCKREGGILLFHQLRERQYNRKWTRRECFRRMDCDEPKYWDAPQVNAAMQFYMDTPRTMEFLQEWERWNSDWMVVGDGPGGEVEDPTFRDHRHDQSILSIMAVKWGLTLYPDPSQFGVGYKQAGRNYGQVVEFVRNVSAAYPIPCHVPG
jgi:hypothetical protein